MFISDKTKHKNTKHEIVRRQKELDKYYSDKELGSFVKDGKTLFRLFAPSAENVKVVVFEKPEDDNGNEIQMNMDRNGVWEAVTEGELYGKFYGYKVFNSKQNLNGEAVCVDPYSKAVASLNTYMNPRKSLITGKMNYDWEGDTWININRHDLIIYEIHIRDITAHRSSGCSNPGTYKGLIEKGITGGLEYIKNFGVNAVELLPAQEFGNYEAPYEGKFNNWNPYERNHWGYMTAAYFAPETYYSDGGKEPERNKWSGKTAEPINEFKDMVKAFHKEGVAVIMDVVYNHLSEYESGNLKQIDKEYYFRLDEKGNYISESGCGNDLKTERKMVRRMIVDSIIYWMKEYHIDGFRLDLAKLIDWKTVEIIIEEARKVNPGVVIIAEPWGGGYDPAGFSLRNWSSWNDQLRNGVKGENPSNGLGWIFGEWYGDNDPDRIKSYIRGTLAKDKHGLFQQPEHSVNYLESHDGYTLGDFIRIGTHEVDPSVKIENIDEYTRLTSLQLKLNKLAALFLFTSQGITMLHSGQEFARGKVVPPDVDVDDPHRGLIDHNSYNRDNETNYINYNHAAINKELCDYYIGLIELRKTFPVFRRAGYNDISFFDIHDPFVIAFSIKLSGDEFIVVLNANREKVQKMTLPEGEWDILVNEKTAGIQTTEIAAVKINVHTSSGVVLKKK